MQGWVPQCLAHGEHPVDVHRDDGGGFNQHSPCIREGLLTAVDRRVPQIMILEISSQLWNTSFNLPGFSHSSHRNANFVMLALKQITYGITKYLCECFLIKHAAALISEDLKSISISTLKLKKWGKSYFVKASGGAGHRVNFLVFLHSSIALRLREGIKS